MNATTGWLLTADEDGNWVVFQDGDEHGTFYVKADAEAYIAECKAEQEEEAREEAEDARREELRSEIAELLENISRIDSLEGLLKSVKRLQD